MQLPQFFQYIKDDIDCILQRDPAARNVWEVVTCYPGLHAIWLHRLSHMLWHWHCKGFARWLAMCSRWLTGIEIHPAAQIGHRVFFDHAMGVVVGETAEIGDGCTIYQGVTLGGTSLYQGQKRHPTLGKNVVVSAGAKVLGGFLVGDGAKIGSNAVVIQPVPAGATAVGIPARIILAKDHSAVGGESTQQRNENSSNNKNITEKIDKTPKFSAYCVGTAHGEVSSSPSEFDRNPDPIGQAMRDLIDHACVQEKQIALLWAALEKLTCVLQKSDCMPCDGIPGEILDAQKIKEYLKC